MNAKTVIIILAIVAVLGGLGYFLQKDKQDKKLTAHNKMKFQQVMTAAKKSNAAGLLVMASAINKFHKIKGHYPKKLVDLHPEFIQDISFISKLNWSYSQEKNSYLIKRSVKGQNTFAAMGPDFRLKTGVIESETQPEVVADVRPEVKKIKTVQAASGQILKSKPDIKEKTTLLQKVEKKFASAVKKAQPDVSAEPEPASKIVKKPLDKNEQFLLSFDNSKFYIWKDSDGFLGFSNMQYPDERQLLVYKNQGWIEYSAR